MHRRVLGTLPDPLFYARTVRAAASSGVRLAELVATISLGTDLGLGQSMEHILRQTLVSLRMAELLAFDEAEREVAYFSGLLAWVAATRMPMNRQSGSEMTSR
jgi:hypothetical protein